jgi:cell division transport system permease protein
MKIIEKFVYFISTTLKGMKSNLYLNTVTIITIAFAFCILNIFFIISTNLNTALGEWKGKIRIIAYLQDGLAESDIISIENKIKMSNGIKSVKYYSKQQALNQFRDELKGQADILNGVSADILPAYFLISVNENVLNNNSLESIANEIKAIKGINDVQYGAQIAQKVSGLLILVKMLGLGIGGFMLFAIFIIVSNTIRISIFSRKDEIEIMKLVGATNAFIEIPFILEGMIQVLTGTILSILLLYIVYKLFLFKLHSNLGSLLINMNISFLSTNSILILLLTGGLLGLAGAIISTGKFIRNSY